MTFYYERMLSIRENDLPADDLIQRAMRAKRFIEEHFAAPLELEEIAAAGNLSKFHFIRVFKSVYGRTPHQYLTSVRIARAKELLKNQKSVTETCFAVGFESVTSFTDLFKRRVGQIPSAFQKTHRSRRPQA
jgi:AraC-like DNA-binding protein